jgi:DNA recombination-dependent growth factor C
VGLLSSSTSIVRFLAPPPPRLDREALARAVTRRAFREADSDGAAAQSFGWIGIHDPLATDFTAADLFFQHYLAVGFRYDRRVVPAKLLFLERRRAEAARRAEDDVARLPRPVRQEIKVEVESRLLVRALPAPRLFDCVWNLDTGRLHFSGRLRAARDMFTALFRDTFGIAPVPLIPYLATEHVGLPPHAVQAVRGVEPASLAPGSPARMPDDVPRLPLAEAEA